MADEAQRRERATSDLMGHTKVDFTKEVYVRALPIMREAASDSLERHFFGELRTTLPQPDAERMM